MDGICFCTGTYEDVPRNYEAEMDEAVRRIAKERASEFGDFYYSSRNCAEDYEAIEPFNDNSLYCWMLPIWNFYEQFSVLFEQKRIYCEDTCDLGWDFRFMGASPEFLLYFAPHIPSLSLMIEEGLCNG